MNSLPIKYGLKTKIHYLNSAKELKKFFNVKIHQTDLGITYYDVDKTDESYVDDHQLDLMMEKLAEQCYNIIFPIQFIRNDNNNILEVTNLEDIIKRWKDKKISIENYFKGEVTAEYLKKFEEILLDEALFNQFITNDFFLFYLTQTRNILGKSYSTTYHHSIPIMSTFGLPFVSKEIIIEETANDDGLIYFEIKSEQAAEFSNFVIYKLIQIKLLENNQDKEEQKWSYLLKGFATPDKTLHNITMNIYFGNSKQTKIEIDISQIT